MSTEEKSDGNSERNFLEEYSREKAEFIRSVEETIKRLEESSEIIKLANLFHVGEGLHPAENIPGLVDHPDVLAYHAAKKTLEAYKRLVEKVENRD